MAIAARTDDLGQMPGNDALLAQRAAPAGSATSSDDARGRVVGLVGRLVTVVPFAPGDDPAQWAHRVCAAASALLSEIDELARAQDAASAVSRWTGTVLSVIDRATSRAGKLLDLGCVQVRPDVGEFDQALWVDLHEPSAKALLTRAHGLTGRRVVWTEVTVPTPDGKRSHRLRSLEPHDSEAAGADEGGLYVSDPGADPPSAGRVRRGAGERPAPVRDGRGSEARDVAEELADALEEATASASSWVPEDDAWGDRGGAPRTKAELARRAVGELGLRIEEVAEARRKVLGAKPAQGPDVLSPEDLEILWNYLTALAPGD